jgi:3-oxoacyl-[acyl-carrier protein] reductase
LRYQSVDLSDPDQVQSWIDNIRIEAAQIDVYINCTGTLFPGKMVWENSAEEIQSMLDANIIAFLNVLRHVIPVMLQQGAGKIITMASNPQGYPLAGLGSYALCKAGIEKIISTLGEELPPGVTAVALYPGLVNTPMLQKSIGESAAEDYQTPQEWAQQASNILLNMDEKYHGQHLSLEGIIDA